MSTIGRPLIGREDELGAITALLEARELPGAVVLTVRLSAAGLSER